MSQNTNRLKSLLMQRNPEPSGIPEGGSAKQKSAPAASRKRRNKRKPEEPLPYSLEPDQENPDSDGDNDGDGEPKSEPQPGSGGERDANKRKKLDNGYKLGLLHLTGEMPNLTSEQQQSLHDKIDRADDQILDYPPDMVPPYDGAPDWYDIMDHYADLTKPGSGKGESGSGKSDLSSDPADGESAQGQSASDSKSNSPSPNPTPQSEPDGKNNPPQLTAPEPRDEPDPQDGMNMALPIPVPVPICTPGADPDMNYSSWYEDIISDLTPNRNGYIRSAILLVGPSGNGKTFQARLALTEMGYHVTELDMNGFQTPYALVGRSTIRAKGQDFMEAWKDGTIARVMRDPKAALLLNEADSMEPEVMLCLQSLLQSMDNFTGRRLTMLDNEEATELEPAGAFPIVFTGNTYGGGGSRLYVGRNRLDAASLNRISIISTWYDLDEEVVQAHNYSAEIARDLAAWALRVRDEIDQGNIPALVTYRDILRIAEDVEDKNRTWNRALDKNFWDRLDPSVMALFNQRIY